MVFEVELAQKNMAVQNLRERVQQKYHVKLDDIRSECITITYADEGPAKVQTLTPDGRLWPQGVARQCRVYLDPETYWPCRLEWWGPDAPRHGEVALLQEAHEGAFAQPQKGVDLGRLRAHVPGHRQQAVLASG